MKSRFVCWPLLLVLLSVPHAAPGGAAVNISYLMPTFARLRLYTYPDSWNDPDTSKQDCFFTTMNFFNETPDTNFFDAGYSEMWQRAEAVAGPS